MQQVRGGDSTSLQIYESRVTNAQFRELMEGCQKLVRLDIPHEQLDDQTFEQVLSQLPELSEVRLNGPVNDAQLQILAGLPRLRLLNLPQGEFSDAALMALENHPRLVLLRFSSPRVTDEGLQVVRKLPAIRFLHVINAPITDAGLKHLYGLTQLESFYLDGGKCTDAGLEELLKNLPELHFHLDQLHLPGDPQAHPHEPAAGG